MIKGLKNTERFINLSIAWNKMMREHISTPTQQCYKDGGLK
tara:strand:- start:88 stop:210 length:123 start_codon:yes stop_codon:yes gene_type:complete